MLRRTIRDARVVRTGVVPADPVRVDAISGAGLLVPPFAEIERPAEVPDMGARFGHEGVALGHALIRRPAASVKLQGTTTKRALPCFHTDPPP